MQLLNGYKMSKTTKLIVCYCNIGLEVLNGSSRDSPLVLKPCNRTLFNHRKTYVYKNL